MTEAIDAVIPRIGFKEARQRMANTGFIVSDCGAFVAVYNQGKKLIAKLNYLEPWSGELDANEVQLIVWSGTQNG